MDECNNYGASAEGLICHKVCEEFRQSSSSGQSKMVGTCGGAYKEKDVSCLIRQSSKCSYPTVLIC